jgi:hypothetical protein
MNSNSLFDNENKNIFIYKEIVIDLTKLSNNKLRKVLNERIYECQHFLFERWDDKRWSKSTYQEDSSTYKDWHKDWIDHTHGSKSEQEIGRHKDSHIDHPK